MRLDKKQNRLRRSRKPRAKMRELRINRLCVHRTPRHIYAQIISSDGCSVLVSASTVEKEVRKATKLTGNKAAAAIIGSRIAKKAKQAGIKLTVLYEELESYTNQ